MSLFPLLPHLLPWSDGTSCHDLSFLNVEFQLGTIYKLIFNAFLCHVSFSIIHSKFFHGIANSKIFFFSVAWMIFDCIFFFIHSSICGYSSSFHIHDITLIVTLNLISYPILPMMKNKISIQRFETNIWIIILNQRYRVRLKRFKEGFKECMLVRFALIFKVFVWFLLKEIFSSLYKLIFKNCLLTVKYTLFQLQGACVFPMNIELRLVLFVD